MVPPQNLPEIAEQKDIQITKNKLNQNKKEMQCKISKDYKKNEGPNLKYFWGITALLT